jgi:hypothetical protein
MNRILNFSGLRDALQGSRSNPSRLYTVVATRIDANLTRTVLLVGQGEAALCKGLPAYGYSGGRTG